MSNPNGLKEVKYTAEVVSRGGRTGQVASSDNRVFNKVDKPTELGGKGLGVNPEQLFGAAYAACLEGACAFVAGQKGVTLSNTSVTARIGFGPREGGGFGLSADMTVDLPGIDRAKAEEILKEAHEKICPFSHLTRGTIDVKVTLK